MIKQTNFFYITHIVPDLLPPGGSLKKLLFYTATLKSYNEGNYYWGLDFKNPFDEIHMKNFEKENKVIRILTGPVKAKTGDGIWINSEGKLYCGNLKKTNGSLLKYLYSPAQLSKAAQIYSLCIGFYKIPEINNFITILR